MWPAWVWAENVGMFGAAEQWLFTAYGDDLIKRDSEKCRRVIESLQYQLRYGDRVTLSKTQNEKRAYENTANGYRVTATVGGQGTGKGGDMLVSDDPLKAEEKESSNAVLTANDWIDKVFSQRKNDPKTTAILLVMQRLLEDDPTGHLLSTDDELMSWVNLRLPNEYERDFKCVIIFDGERVRNFEKRVNGIPRPHTVDDLKYLASLPRLSFSEDKRGRREYEDIAAKMEKGEPFVLMEDERQYENALLFGDRTGGFETEELKLRLGGDYLGQQQQRPKSGGAGEILERYFRFWQPEGLDLPPVVVRDENGDMFVCETVTLPKVFQSKVQSWDLSFKKTVGSSRVSGQVWARAGANMYLLDEDTRKMDIVDSLRAIERMTVAYPDAFGKLIEDKANGPAVMQLLRNKVPGLIPIPKDLGKEAVVNSVMYLLKGGNVILPHPNLKKWVHAYIAEWVSFPGTYTDRVDAGGQALRELGVLIDLEAQSEDPQTTSQKTY